MTYYVKRADCTATTDVRKLNGEPANSRNPHLLNDLVFVEGVLRRVVVMKGNTVEVSDDLGRYYLAGPMRGYDLFNFPAFLAAEAVLQSRGFRIASPARHDLEENFDPSKPLDKQVGWTLEKAMGWDFKTIPSCDGIILMDGWEASTGAKAERLIAEMTRKRIYRINKTMELRTDEGWKSTLTWAQV